MINDDIQKLYKTHDVLKRLQRRLNGACSETICPQDIAEALYGSSQEIWRCEHCVYMFKPYGSLRYESAQIGTITRCPCEAAKQRWFPLNAEEVLAVLDESIESIETAMIFANMQPTPEK